MKKEIRNTILRGILLLFFFCAACGKTEEAPAQQAPAGEAPSSVGIGALYEGKPGTGGAVAQSTGTDTPREESAEEPALPEEEELFLEEEEAVPAEEAAEEETAAATQETATETETEEPEAEAGEEEAGEDASADSRLEQSVFLADQKLVMATNYTTPPYAYALGDGTLAGLDIEVVREIARRLHIDWEFQHMDFSTATLLIGNRVDAAITGVEATPEREMILDFTIPYYENYCIAVPKGADVMKEILDEVIAQMISDGTIDTLAEQYVNGGGA